MIKNDIHDVPKFSTFMKSVMEKLNIEKSLARRLRLAVEEAVVNVIDYAYRAGQEGDLISYEKAMEEVQNKKPKIVAITADKVRNAADCIRRGRSQAERHPSGERR